MNSMTSPRISVIIPVYNVAPYIERCLDSVVAQTYQNIEVIIVDDCGSDNSMELVNRFIISHAADWKILSHEHNRGLSAARNTGVSQADGDYLFFLDSDDELPPQAMQWFVNYLLLYGDSDFLIGDYLIEGNYKFRKLSVPQTMLEGTISIMDAFLRGEWYVMACGKLIKRSFFVRHNLWFVEGRLHEDELFSFQLALSASRIILLEEPVYTYIIREGSITVAPKEKNYIDQYWIIEEKIRLIEKNKKLFNVLSPETYIMFMLFLFASSISYSNLSVAKKKVFMKWVRREASLLAFKKMSVKSKCKRVMLMLPNCLFYKVAKVLA